MTDFERNPFVNYLVSVAAREDRGALSKLRRALGHEPAEVPDALRYIVPFSGGGDLETLRNLLLLAGLFASHPDNTDRADHNFGASLRELKRARGDAESIDRRVAAVLNAHPDDLAGHLRSLVQLLRTDGITINYTLLYKDIQRWRVPERWAQLGWARSYWATNEQLA